MIRKFTLLVLGLVLSLSLKAQDWRDELLAQNVGVIDSVVLLNDTKYSSNIYSSYMIHYHQPIDHDAPKTGSLPLRALLMISHKFDDINNTVTQMSIGGYALDTAIVNHPNVWAHNHSYNLSMGEVAGTHFGHVLMPEHRFYGESRPDNYTTLMNHCNAKEAAADFHALAEAMKKVFKGKWAITGVSKGGVATAIQHAFYPEDADLFVPYVSPFNNGISDLSQQEYWLTKSWTPELREHAMHIQKEMLNRPEIKKYVITQMYYLGGKDTITALNDNYKFLNEIVNSLDEQIHQFTDRSVIEKSFSDNQAYLQELGLTDYTDAMLLYMIFYEKYTIEKNDFELWKEFFYDEEETRLTRGVVMPTSLTEDEVYSYQSLTELGYYDIKWDYYYDTQAQVDSVNNLWKSYSPHLVLYNAPEAFLSLEFDPWLMNFIKQQTAQAKKPILFIYGEDDPWTGACIDDEYINGTNVRKYILPAQCHTASIYDVKDEALKKELKDFIESILYPSPDGISEVNDEPTAAPAGIVFDQQNRRIVIRRNGQEYDVMGKKVF